MKRLLIAAASLALMACSKGAELIEGNPSDPRGGFEAITDLSKCKGTPLPTSIQGSWEALLVSGDFQVSMTFSFYQEEAELTNICELNGAALSATAIVPYHNYGKYIRFLSGKSDKSIYDEDEVRFSCVAEIYAGVTNYSFMGRCLKLQLPNMKPLIFAPVN